MYGNNKIKSMSLDCQTCAECETDTFNEAHKEVACRASNIVKDSSKATAEHCVAYSSGKGAIVCQM